MWSRRAYLVGLTALAGCGFTPLYGPVASGAVLRDNVALVTPDTVLGFRLRDALVGRLGSGAAPRYTLTVDLTDELAAAAISTDGDTTRFSVIGTADWNLSESGVATASGTVSTFTGYDATGSTVATQAAERDARDRLAASLADLIVADLVLAMDGR